MVLSENRRRFLAMGACALLGTLSGRTSAALRPKPRIVILGGGFAGSRLAKSLIKLVPDASIQVVDANDRFVSGPSVLPFLFGEQPLSSISFDYRTLGTLGIKFTHAQVVGVAPSDSFVETTSGRIQYDFLVVATGTRYSVDHVNGLKEHPEENASPFDRARVSEVRAKLRSIQSAPVVVCISAASTMCPPAPYEYTLLLAEYMAKNSPSGKIVVMDGNLAPVPEPLSTAFRQEMASYGDLIEYVPAAGEAVNVDVAKKRVVTSYGDEIQYGVLSVFPAGAVASWVPNLNSSMPGDIYVEVDPLSLRTLAHSNIYAIGDVARTPYGKSAYAATVCAERCALAIARQLGKPMYDASREVEVACFPYLGKGRSMEMRVHYQFERDRAGLHLKSRVKVSNGSASIHASRIAWERDTIRQNFQLGAAQ